MRKERVLLLCLIVGVGLYPLISFSTKRQEDAGTFKFEPRGRNLIFTSAGDRNFFRPAEWIKDLDPGEVDLVVYYYGTKEQTFKDYQKIATYVKRANATKFDNFFAFYWEHRQELLRANYEYVAMFDDDITWNHDFYLSQPYFRKLFEFCHQHQPWVAGPALDPDAVNQSFGGWTQTYQQQGAEFHYVNLVEMNTMILRMDKVRELMLRWPAGEFLAFGMDLWIIQTLGANLMDKYMIIDAVPYVNPVKAGLREIDTWRNQPLRVEAWEAFADAHDLQRSLGRLSYGVHFKGVRDPAVPGRFRPITAVEAEIATLRKVDRLMLARYLTQASNVMFWGVDEAVSLAAQNRVPKAFVIGTLPKGLRLPAKFQLIARPPADEAAENYFLFLQAKEPFDIYYIEGPNSLAAVAASFLHASQLGRSPAEFVVIVNEVSSKRSPLLSMAWVVDERKASALQAALLVLRRKTATTDQQLQDFLESAMS